MQKKILKIIISVYGITFLSFSSAVNATGEQKNFAGGSGSEDDPYLVETAEQLDNIRHHLDKHFKQISDIDLSEYEDGDGWEPMGHYKSMDDYEGLQGSYDGKGYEIENLSIERPESSGVGLFVAVGENAVISHVRLKNVDISGDYGVGGLVGGNEGLITQCYASGDVRGEVFTGILVGGNMGEITECSVAGNTEGAEKTGGVVGGNEGAVSLSYSTGEVMGNEFVGGLVGGTEGAIACTYATGDVTGQDAVAGLVGGNRGDIIQSYAVGKVQGEDRTAGLVARNFLGSVRNSYYDKQTTGQEDTTAGSMPKTTSEMMERDIFEAWNFEDIWAMEEENSYPYLQFEEREKE